MCEPATMMAISTGLSVAMGGMQMMGQQQRAQAQADAQARQIANARQAFVNDTAALQERRLQESAAASQQMREQQRKAVRARATARTEAGEAGVSGLSVDALQRDFYSRELNYLSAVRQNYDNTSRQIDRQLESAGTGFQTRVNQAPRVQQPNYLGIGLRIGTDAFSNYNTYLRQPSPT